MLQLNATAPVRGKPCLFFCMAASALDQRLVGTADTTGNHLCFYKLVQLHSHNGQENKRQKTGGAII